jgi:lon-related putative ATP-dependent protease
MPAGAENAVIPKPLDANQLCAQVPLDALPESSAKVEPIEQLTGQSRARDAIVFGLGLDSPGYNIAVSGQSASGRTTAVRRLVDEAAADRQPVPDWCYLHNFSDPYRPRAVALQPGMGANLQRDLARLVDACRTELPKAFEGESYQERSRKAVEPLNHAREQLLEDMQHAAAQQGFAVNVTPMGLAAIPLGQDGQPLQPEVLASLSEDARHAIERRGEAVEETITATARELRKLDVKEREAIDALDREVTHFIVGHVLDELREKYGPVGMADHFDAIERDILENLARYTQFSATMLQQVPAQLVAQATEEREQLLRRYSANLFVTHDRDQGTKQGGPVVEERNPTYSNLFGRIDYQVHFGAMTTDFQQIRPGALHLSNGGYLILQLDELLMDARAWIMLKRALKTGEVRVEGIGDGLLQLPMVNMIPAPIPLSVKVMLIGQPMTVALLDAVDPDFSELFKIRAEFEPDMVCDRDSMASYAAFVSATAKTSQLLPFRRDALVEVVHHGNRLAGRQDKVSTQFGAIADLCQEANHLAKAAKARQVTAEHVLGALESKRRRSSLVPDRMRAMIAEGTMHIETAGAVVGQLNGLAVYELGGHAFGTPIRISCQVGLGRRGVVAIEREVERSGAIHSKGVLVLSGYLMGTFGRRRSLAFTSSLTFEQSYDEVEGDSASSAELYAILTAIAGVPIRQDVAVTGSVDQFGHIQAVGGVTEKVEGFYDVCHEVGMKGTEGVIIPASNIVNLTLRPEIVEAVARGRFRIWPVTTVEQGLEILTGIEAGEVRADGSYPEGTVMSRVSDAIDLMHEMAAKDVEGR